MIHPQRQPQGVCTQGPSGSLLAPDQTITPDRRPPSVIVIDDHRVFVDLFSSALRVAGYRVVATPVTMAEGAAAVEMYQPDILILDRQLPDGDGISGLAGIRASTPGIRVLMLTSATDRSVLCEALEAGCDGYITKSRGITEVLAAIEAMRAGDTPISTDVGPASLKSVPMVESTITAREMQVLQLVCAGLSNPDIADALTLSVNTVRNHVAHVLDKLGVRSKLEAVARAHRLGIVEADHQTAE